MRVEIRQLTSYLEVGTLPKLALLKSRTCLLGALLLSNSILLLAWLQGESWPILVSWREISEGFFLCPATEFHFAFVRTAGRCARSLDLTNLATVSEMHTVALLEIEDHITVLKHKCVSPSAAFLAQCPVRVGHLYFAVLF